MHCLSLFLNNPWSISVITGLISGFVVSAYYRIRDQRREYDQLVYDFRSYLVMVYRALEEYEDTNSDSRLRDVVFYRDPLRILRLLMTRHRLNRWDRIAIQKIHDDLKSLYQETQSGETITGDKLREHLQKVRSAGWRMDIFGA